MAVDKLVDSTQLDADLTSVANAIRTKGGTSASLAFPAGFVSAVEAIPTGGGGGSKENITVKFHNARASGACTFTYPQYNDALDAIAASGANASTGATPTAVLLVVDGVIVFKTNNALSYVSFNGTELPKTSAGSGANRFHKVTLPSDFVSGDTLDFE